MAELSARIHLKAPKSTDLTAVRKLFASDSKDAFIDVAESIDPEHGNTLARDFAKSIESFEELVSGRTRNVRSFATWHFVLGSEGVSQTERILEFLLKIVPGSEAWAYVVTDDDPVETWLRTANESVIREENEPGQDSEADREALETIYAWWHDGLPEAIWEGQLVDSREAVPKPRPVEKVVTKTQVSGVEDVTWENLFFNMIVNKDEDLEPDWQNPRSEMTEEAAAKALRLLRSLRANYRGCNVQFEGRGHSGSNGSIQFTFSTVPVSNVYPLNYAALCVQVGATLDQFVSTHPDREVHYLSKDETIVLETRQGKTVVETVTYGIDEILEIAESNAGL